MTANNRPKSVFLHSMSGGTRKLLRPFTWVFSFAGTSLKFRSFDLRGQVMPKYLFEARYTSDGAKGLAREGGSGRRAAVARTVESVGGKLEAAYFAFGDVDVYMIVDLPDNVSAAAVSLAANESGFIASKTIVLMTAEEMDQAAKKKVEFRPPGR
jgi:uncharacterized protein with GYD domain